MIQCLKTLSRKHRMCLIISIHQPNNQIFHMFDKIYVLAKGGINVFSGHPENLRTHLFDSNIEYNESQIPNEVLIKISFNGINDENVKQLLENNRKYENGLKLIESDKSLIEMNRFSQKSI